MNRILSLFLVLLCNSLIAQSTIPLTDNLEMVFVDGVSDNRKPKTVDNLLFLYQYEPATLYFGYKLSETSFKVIGKFTEDVEGFNSAKSNCEFRNDTIVLWSQYPFKAAESTYLFTWNGKKITYLSVSYFDPSEEAIYQAEKALEEGKIQEAIDYYYQVQYPFSYMREDEVAMQILSKAHELAFKLAKDKNYSKGIEYMDAALNFYAMSEFMNATNEKELNDAFENSGVPEYKDSLGLWMGNYGYFLYKGDSLQRSIHENTWINNAYPKLSGPYLQRADALYDLGKKTEAKSIYLIFINLMKEKGKEKSIPGRVLDRSL